MLTGWGTERVAKWRPFCRWPTSVLMNRGMGGCEGGFRVPCQREPFVLAAPSVDSVVQILQSPRCPQVKAMLLNYAEADLFNPHVSRANKGIHQKHLICIPRRERGKFASLSHQTMFITLIILWYSDEHPHHLTPPESATAEPLMSAAIADWLNIQVEKSPGLKSRAWRGMNIGNSEMTRDGDNVRRGIDTIVNGNSQYRVTFWKEGSWEKALRCTIWLRLLLRYVPIQYLQLQRATKELRSIGFLSRAERTSLNHL